MSQPQAYPVAQEPPLPPQPQLNTQVKMLSAAKNSYNWFLFYVYQYVYIYYEQDIQIQNDDFEDELLQEPPQKSSNQL